MTHPMIEKCARALWAVDVAGWEEDKRLIDRHWDLYHEQFRREALAVLRTLREPDEGMVEAASCMVDDEAPAPFVINLFRAMIDSILPEENSK